MNNFISILVGSVRYLHNDFAVNTEWENIFKAAFRYTVYVGCVLRTDIDLRLRFRSLASGAFENFEIPAPKSITWNQRYKIESTRSQPLFSSLFYSLSLAIHQARPVNTQAATKLNTIIYNISALTAPLYIQDGDVVSSS
jgi:hypothetical protein